MANPRAAQLVEAGMWLRLSGDHEGARRLFEQALKLDPENAQARQLLGSEPAAAPPEPSQPFAPAPTSSSAELDWGSATGFSPTPVPFIPPATMPVEAPGSAIELDFEPLPPPSSTQFFGQTARQPEFPPPAPTVPEDWGDGAPSSPTMLFHESAAAAGAFTEAPPPSRPRTTMEFARPSELLAAPESQTIQFGQSVPLIPDESWRDLESFPVDAFSAVPTAPAPSEPRFAPNATSAWDRGSNPGIKLSELDPGMGAALDLVSAGRPASSPPAVPSKLDEVRTLLRGAKDLLGLDDHSGAMDLILMAQELAPNDPEVQALRTRSEATLEAMFESKLGKLSKAPRVKLKDDEIIWLNLDHRAGFVLAQIDGQVTFDDLFEVSGMSRLDTARILAQLIEEGVITS